MKIIIEETGKVKEIRIKDAKTGLDWSGDFIGDNLVTPEYKYSEAEDEELLVMVEDDFNWWSELAGKYESSDLAVKEYFDSLEYSPAWEAAHDAYIYTDRKGCDLENLPDAMKAALEDAKEVYRNYSIEGMEINYENS